KSNPELDPTGSQDGPTYNQCIASLIATGQVALLSGMFADHIAPYFTGAVNQTGVQAQDNIIRTVYGANAVRIAVLPTSANSPRTSSVTPARPPTIIGSTAAARRKASSPNTRSCGAIRTI